MEIDEGREADIAELAVRRVIVLEGGHDGRLVLVWRRVWVVVLCVVETCDEA